MSNLVLDINDLIAGYSADVIDEYYVPYSEVIYKRILKLWGEHKKSLSPAKRKKSRLVINGITFDSMYEGARFVQLYQYLGLKVISNLYCQPGPFEVWAGTITKYHGKLRATKYTPDFGYIYQGVQVYEDAKGNPRVPSGPKNRIKMLRAMFPASYIDIVVHGQYKTLPVLKESTAWQKSSKH